LAGAIQLEPNGGWAVQRARPMMLGTRRAPERRSHRRPAGHRKLTALAPPEITIAPPS
jgi:hypothetical protein